MDTKCDMKKRVLHLESIGRKICSDLRNFQKERTILSQEAKCLIREIEKGKARRRHYSKNKHSNNTSCTCAIWENDLIKNDDSDFEESSKFQKEDEQLLTCKSCCECCDALDEENNNEDLFKMDKCSICRFNEIGEPFNCTKSVTIINDADDDANDNAACCFGKSNAIEDNTNDVNCMIGSCEACAIDSTEFCDICVFSEKNNAKNMHVLSTNHKCNINNVIERQRGGGGRSDSESTNDETTNTSICTCECDICALRNKHGVKLPYCLQENEQLGRSLDVDYDENLHLNHSVVSELSEIHQYCKITKLREALEKLKNHNHVLRKLLKKRDCLITNSMMEQANYKCCLSSCNHVEDNNCVRDNTTFRNDCKKIPGELTAILKILQSKCRTKDGMIVALADELKECANDERIKRILDKLADANVHCDIIDFDRSTLWKYLISKEFNLMQQNSCRRKSIVCKKAQCNEITIGIIILSFIFLANIYYRYRCTVIFVFRTICETFYRVYDILQNCQQCFASNYVMVFFMKNCINCFETFLSLFNCHQLVVHVDKITRDFTFFSNDGFPWMSIICICATILILFFCRACYSFVAICSEPLQYIYDTHRNDVPNECE